MSIDRFLLAALLPPQAYDPLAPRITASLEGDAKALAQAEALASRAWLAIFPDTGEGLDDWERLMALPDPCLNGLSRTTDQRISAVVSKLQAERSPSRAALIQQAEALGHQATITEFRPARAGIATPGSAVYGGDWAHTWRLNVAEVEISQACAGTAVAGEPLASWANRQLECRLNQLKPAHTILLFGYGALNAKDQ